MERKSTKVQLYFGDCLDLMEEIPDASVDMVLCDLPYGTTNCKWDTLLPFSRLWQQYARICKGAIVLFAQTPFDKVLGVSNIQNLRYEWIWEKSHATGYLNAKKMPMKAHENILVFYENLPTYNPIKTFGHIKKSAVKRKDNSPIYGMQDFMPLTYNSTERYPRSVLKFASDKQKSNLHPTQKPVALCEYLIKTYTNEGDNVLDNCMGSGTTGIACVKTKRNFIGIELDENYYKVAKNRIEAALASIKE